jgi:hypothetical protein
MAITYVDSAITTSTTPSLPAHQTGDLILIFTLRNNTVVNYFTTDYLSIGSGGSNQNSILASYRIAQSNSEPTPTVNASVHCAHVYRSTTGKIILPSCIGIGTPKTASTVITIANHFYESGGWAVVAAHTETDDSSIDTAPSGLTVRQSTIFNTTWEGATYDTNGDPGSEVSIVDHSIGGTAADNRTLLVSLIESQYSFTSGGGVPLIGSGGLVY